MSAYGQSKLANVLHANELARRLKVTDLFEVIDYLLFLLASCFCMHCSAFSTLKNKVKT